ncbi:MAG: uroporphyrinogen decarboxylase family protein, partial [Planctomycetota bacterium]
RELGPKAPNFIAFCLNPEMAAEATLQPMRRFGFDAAIVFADILLTADALGVEVTFPNGGPRITTPIRRPEDVERIHEPKAERVRAVSETVAILRRTLPETKAVIGFSAAPFTLCAYMIEGGTSRDFNTTRRFAHEHPRAFRTLLERAADALVPYLLEQARAGADVLQLFDTWGGVLTPALYRTAVVPALRRVIEGLGSDRPPVILFAGIGAEARLEDAAGLGVEALSLDWRTDLGQAYATLGHRVRLQGNLDPTILLTTPERVGEETRAMLLGVPLGRPHLANLGHGILKETPPENAKAFVDAVRSYRPEIPESTVA